MSECEIAEFFYMETPTARKSHKCCECGVKINPREEYIRCTGKWSFGLESYKQHLACKQACVLIRDEFNDGECIGFGELFECYHEHAVPWYGRHENDKFWTSERIRREKQSPAIKELRRLMAIIFNRQRGGNLERQKE